MGKRLMDASFAAIGLAVTWPLFIISAIAIGLNSRGPIFFRQVRVGLHGKPFRIMKFRTMRERADENGPRVTAEGDPRITRVGKWLRKTKVDEIPQLLNVLRGDMSLVGPRPEIPEYVAAYSPAQRSVLLAKPGVTGPATLSFVDEEKLLAQSLEKEHFYLTTLMPIKLKLDLAYCGDIRLSEDLRLILHTLVRLILRPRKLPNINLHTES
jgi:lipopolysaccharide/colanic/teichoic acid biosynthesis glycosyltransferase